MSISRQGIRNLLRQWNRSWDQHDLDGVMELFHDDVMFENWTGAIVVGKNALRKAWQSWFANHGGFRFTEEETFIDEEEQKALYRWSLEWPSFEEPHEGRREIRRGVDVLHFKNGKIIKKLSYSKTSIEIETQRYRLHL